jgi:hypothetical protein
MVVPRVGLSLSWKVAGTGLAAAMVTLVGFETVQNPQLNRALLAFLIVAVLSFVGVRRPRATVLLTFAFLVVLGLVRRLLIPIAGWSSYDPLLLVAPLVSGFLVVRVFVVQRRKFAPDLLSKLIVALLLLMLLEAFNPLGNGALAGLVGLLFVAAPLVWFFIGREVADRHTVWTLLRWVVILGLGSAIYGLWQTTGLPPWDTAWLNIGGYNALRITSEVTSQGIIRPFGTFSSSAEYASYLAIAVGVAVAMALRRRLLALAAVPLLAWALFLESSRGPVLLVLVAVILLIGLRTTKPWAAIAIVAISLGGGVAAASLLGQGLQESAVGSANPLIIHQVGGLLHPFDPNQSTLTGHWKQLADSLDAALHNPLGTGTGVITRPDKFGTAAAGSDEDLTAAFIGLGLPGALLFLTIVCAALWKVVSAYRRHHDVSALCVPAVLFVTFLQWLNGGQYAVAPLIWFCIGWATQESARRARDPGRAPARSPIPPRVGAN